ncbi:hypothetical protein DFH94DRAFT_634049, partial [Russula ochroleuca]
KGVKEPWRCSGRFEALGQTLLTHFNRCGFSSVVKASSVSQATATSTAATGTHYNATK